MFEPDCSDDENELSYKSVTNLTRKEDVPLTLWLEHFCKPEKERNRSLTKIFEKEFNLLKGLYVFLETDQVFGRTLTKFGIPHFCGKINKRALKSFTKGSNKVNKYERRNKTYLSNPCALSKKPYSKPCKSNRDVLVTSRYSRLNVERLPSFTSKNYKSVQEYDDAQNYPYTEDMLETAKNKEITPPVQLVSKLTKTASDLCSQKMKNGNTINNTKTLDTKPFEIIDRSLYKKRVTFNDNDLCSFAPTQELLTSSSSIESFNYNNVKEIRKESTVSTSDPHTSIQNEMKDKQVDSNQNSNKAGFEIEPYDCDNIFIENSTESNSEGKCEIRMEKNQEILTETVAEEDEGDTCKLSNKANIETAKNTSHLPFHKIATKEKDNDYNHHTVSTVSILIQRKDVNQKITKLTQACQASQSLITNDESESNNSTKTKAITIPETPSSDEIIDGGSLRQDDSQCTLTNQSKKSHTSYSNGTLSDGKIVVPETPSTNESTSSYTLVKNSKQSNVFKTKEENCLQNELYPSRILSPTHLESTYSSDDEFFPLSPLAPNIERNIDQLLTNLKSLETGHANNILKESHLVQIPASSTQFQSMDHSDDEFFPLSPLSPHNENSANITAINGRIISSEESKKTCIVNSESSFRNILLATDVQGQNSNLSVESSPCTSLSGRDYLSDSFQSENEEPLSQECYMPLNPTNHSSVSTPDTDSNTVKLRKHEELFAVNAPVKSKSSTCNDKSPLVMFQATTNQTSGSKLCKALFPEGLLLENSSNDPSESQSFARKESEGKDGESHLDPSLCNKTLKVLSTKSESGNQPDDATGENVIERTNETNITLSQNDEFYICSQNVPASSILLHDERKSNLFPNSQAENEEILPGSYSVENEHNSPERVEQTSPSKSSSVSLPSVCASTNIDQDEMNNRTQFENHSIPCTILPSPNETDMLSKEKEISTTAEEGNYIKEDDNMEEPTYKLPNSQSEVTDQQKQNLSPNTKQLGKSIRVQVKADNVKKGTKYFTSKCPIKITNNEPSTEVEYKSTGKINDTSEYETSGKTRKQSETSERINSASNDNLKLLSSSQVEIQLRTNKDINSMPNMADKPSVIVNFNRFHNIKNRTLNSKTSLEATDKKKEIKDVNLISENLNQAQDGNCIVIPLTPTSSAYLKTTQSAKNSISLSNITNPIGENKSNIILTTSRILPQELGSSDYDSCQISNSNINEIKNETQFKEKTLSLKSIRINLQEKQGIVKDSDFIRESPSQKQDVATVECFENLNISDNPVVQEISSSENISVLKIKNNDTNKLINDEIGAKTSPKNVYLTAKIPQTLMNHPDKEMQVDTNKRMNENPVMCSVSKRNTKLYSLNKISLSKREIPNTKFNQSQTSNQQAMDKEHENARSVNDGVNKRTRWFTSSAIHITKNKPLNGQSQTSINQPVTHENFDNDSRLNETSAMSCISVLSLAEEDKIINFTLDSHTNQIRKEERSLRLKKSSGHIRFTARSIPPHNHQSNESVTHNVNEIGEPKLISSQIKPMSVDSVYGTDASRPVLFTTNRSPLKELHNIDNDKIKVTGVLKPFGIEIDQQFPDKVLSTKNPIHVKRRTDYSKLSEGVNGNGKRRNDQVVYKSFPTLNISNDILANTEEDKENIHHNFDMNSSIQKSLTDTPQQRIEAQGESKLKKNLINYTTTSSIPVVFTERNMIGNEKKFKTIGTGGNTQIRPKDILQKTEALPVPTLKKNLISYTTTSTVPVEFTEINMMEDDKKSKTFEIDSNTQRRPRLKKNVISYTATSSIPVEFTEINMMEDDKKSKTFEIDSKTQRRPIDNLQKTKTLQKPRLKKNVISYTATSSIPVEFTEINMMEDDKKSKTFEIDSNTQSGPIDNLQKTEALQEPKLKKNVIGYTTTSSIPVEFTEINMMEDDKKSKTFEIDSNTQSGPIDNLQKTEALQEPKLKKNVISYTTTSSIPVEFTEINMMEDDKKSKTFEIDSNTQSGPIDNLQKTEALQEPKLKKNVISCTTTSSIPVEFTELNMMEDDKKSKTFEIDSNTQSGPIDNLQKTEDLQEPKLKKNVISYTTTSSIPVEFIEINMTEDDGKSKTFEIDSNTQRRPIDNLQKIKAPQEPKLKKKVISCKTTSTIPVEFAERNMMEDDKKSKTFDIDSNTQRRPIDNLQKTEALQEPQFKKNVISYTTTSSIPVGFTEINVMEDDKKSKTFEIDSNTQRRPIDNLQKTKALQEPKLKKNVISYTTTSSIPVEFTEINMMEDDKKSKTFEIDSNTQSRPIDNLQQTEALQEPKLKKNVISYTTTSSIPVEFTEINMMEDDKKSKTFEIDSNTQSGPIDNLQKTEALQEPKLKKNVISYTTTSSIPVEFTEINMMEDDKKSKTFEIYSKTQRRPIDNLQKTETLHEPKLRKNVISYTTTSSIPVEFTEINMMEHGKKFKTFEIDRSTERRPIDILQKTETLHGPKLEKKVISYTTTSSIPVVFAEKNMKEHGKKSKTFEIGSSTQKTPTYNPQSKTEAQSESMLKKNCISYTTTSTIPVVFIERHAKRVENKRETFGIDYGTKESPRNIMQNSEALGESKLKKNVISYSTTSTIPVVFTERNAKRVENKNETFGIDYGTKERPRNVLQNSEALGESKLKKNVISYSTTSTIPVVFTERNAKRVENKNETFGIDSGTKERPRNVLQNSEALGESKLKKNVISYSTTSIIPVVFPERNMNDVQNKFMSLLTDSPPESVKSLDFGESQDSDKQFNEINESIVSSDEESLQNLRDSIECTNGNLSPFSSIGSNSLNSSKRLKRRLLDSLDYTSDDSEYKSSSKFLRTDLLNSPSSETSEFLGVNVISSDDFAEPYDGSEKFSMKNPKGDKTSRLLQMNTSPQYDYNLRDGSIPDELTSGHPSSMNAASPFPSFSDEVNMRSSSDRGFADLNVDSPLYDRDMQSSDEDIDNYLVNIFDD